MAVILDPQISGISGNMVVGSLIDIGADESDVIDVMEYYGSFFGDLNVKISRVRKSGISASYVQVESTDEGEIKYKDLLRKLENIKPKVDGNILNFAKSVFKTISTAEARVHGTSLSDVHFHEVGAADAVADIIGAAYCFYNLGLNDDKVYGMPVALGGGKIQIKHGDLSVPAPATLEILKNMPVFGGPEEYELTTPTGAALYANMVDETCTFYPLMVNEKIGYGAGKHDLKKFSNVLRVIKGHMETPTDNVSILETNIDNISAEVIGHTFHKLQDAGALDVTVIPLIMKKNRPGHLLRAITRPENCNSVAEAIIRETGTLGVRIMPYVHRNIVNREITPIMININKVNYKINIKSGKIGEDIINYSPEYEDARRIAKETGMPLKDVMKRATETFKKMLE